jgi:hypothetical protein
VIAMNAGAAVHIGVGMNLILLIAWAVFATPGTEATAEASPTQRTLAVVAPEALAPSTLTGRAALALRIGWRRMTRLAPETPLPHP